MAEGARLESGCASKRRTEGSNPSLSEVQFINGNALAMKGLMAIAVPSRQDLVNPARPGREQR